VTKQEKLQSLKLHLEKTRNQLGKNPKKDAWVRLEIERTAKRIAELSV
jgi:hypothetical protein